MCLSWHVDQSAIKQSGVTGGFNDGSNGPGDGLANIKLALSLNRVYLLKKRKLEVKNNKIPRSAVMEKFNRNLQALEFSQVKNFNISELNRAIKSCTDCELSQTRTNAVPGSSLLESMQWFILGEAPGAQEDQTGLPFVGRSGKLLSELLQKIGINREREVFITNTVKCRPPANRNPEEYEIDTCKKYLLRQLELVQPKIIVALGRFAAFALLEHQEPINSLRNRVLHFNKIPLVVSYHPSYALRNPSGKEKLLQDLTFAK